MWMNDSTSRLPVIKRPWRQIGQESAFDLRGNDKRLIGRVRQCAQRANIAAERVQYVAREQQERPQRIAVCKAAGAHEGGSLFRPAEQAVSDIVLQWVERGQPAPEHCFLNGQPFR